MALKTKKGLPFGDSRKDAPEEEDVRETERDPQNTGDEPYIVFETEADFRDALKREMDKQNGRNDTGYSTGDQRIPQRSGMLAAAWQRDAKALKEIVPEFDLAEALRRPEFTDILRRGGSIVEAYAEISRLPKQPQRDSIYQNAHMAQRGTGEASRNPAKLSSADFKEYIDNIKNR